MKDAIILIFANKQDLPDGEWGHITLAGYHMLQTQWWISNKIMIGHFIYGGLKFLFNHTDQ